MIRFPKWVVGMLALALLLGLPAAVWADDKAADQAKPGDATAQGQVTKIQADHNQFSLKGRDGQEMTFRVARDSVIRLNNKDSKFADLKEGDEVAVRYRLHAQDVRFDTAARATEAIRGQVKQVAAGQNQLILKDQNGKDVTFQLGQDTKVRVNNKDGKLSDLKEGDDVMVRFQRQDDRLMVREICSDKDGQATDVTRGKIQSVAADTHQLVLKDRDGKEWTFHVARDAKVRLDDRDSSLSDLKTGNEVTIAYSMAAQDIRSNRK
jgi:Cu/Ag efflux protein CusF